MKRKIKWRVLIPLILILIGITILVISIVDITEWKIDSNKLKEQVEKIQEKVKIIEVQDSENIEIIEQEEEVPQFNPYWDYIKMNLINVDFNELKQMNLDTKGWIQVNGTNINYPFVQATDNKFYLDHSFDKTYNEAGWVFLDYRNNIDNLSKNTILYAHSRLDTTMFGSLNNILKSEWINNTDNYVIKLSTEKENTLWQVFSVYTIPTTNDYIQVNFNSSEEFKNWTNLLINRSAYNFNALVSENDYVLTLSTCYSDTKKTVLHAKLIKKETRI